MKRLIKFYNSIGNNLEWSECSTEWEGFPVLLDDSAGMEELKEHGTRLGFKVDLRKARELKTGYRQPLTHAVPIGTTKVQRFNGPEEKTLYLGLVHIPKGVLPVLETLGSPVTEEQAFEVINMQDYGVADIGETVDREYCLVKRGWNYFHDLRLAGYSLESFEKALGVTEHGFEDDTIRCHECGLYDGSDNGYTYNHRVVMECHLLGIRCGCFDEWCQSTEALEYYSNNPDQAMELETAEKHAESGTLEFIERFIGGWTDGRGGCFGGEATREGNPEDVLEELLEKDPDGEYLFSHDESGQFQTYFSVWKVTRQNQRSA